MAVVVALEFILGLLWDFRMKSDAREIVFGDLRIIRGDFAFKKGLWKDIILEIL